MFWLFRLHSVSLNSVCRTFHGLWWLLRLSVSRLVQQHTGIDTGSNLKLFAVLEAVTALHFTTSQTKHPTWAPLSCFGFILAVFLSQRTYRWRNDKQTAAAFPLSWDAAPFGWRINLLASLVTGRRSVNEKMHQIRKWNLQKEHKLHVFLGRYKMQRAHGSFPKWADLVVFNNTQQVSNWNCIPISTN